MSEYSGNRGRNSATIQLVVREQGDEHALSQLLSDTYEVITSPELTSADCYIIDGQELPQYFDALVERKQQAHPVFLPSLLIQRKSSPLDVDVFEQQAADVVLLDELIHAPVGKPTLDRRLENLLARREQSQSLQSDLQRMKRAVDSSGLAIYITDTEGTIEYVNPAFEEITEFSQEEAVGRNPRILNSGEMPDTYFEDLWETVSSGKSWKEEVVNRRKSGERYVAEQTIAPVTAASGEIEGFVAIQQDITERKRREDTLRKYKQAVESSKDLLTAIDGEYNYLFANEMYREYHGVGPVNIRNYTVPEVIGDESFETAKPKIERALNGEEIKYEQTRPHPEKGEVILDVWYFPLKDEAGEIRGIGASMRDITRQKRLQNNLEESKERYESLFNSIRDAILVANTEREIINCNPAFVELFGYELDEIEGKQTKYMYASEEAYRKMGEAIEGHIGDPQFTHKVEYEKKSGQTFPGETNVFYLRDAEDEIVGFIGVIRDVSDHQNRLRQLQRVDRVLQHNFHNDINVIQGFAEKIEREAAAPFDGFAEKVGETGESLLRTVENERKITKFLSDPPPSESLNLRRVCEVVIERVSHAHPQASVVTECSVDIVIDATPAIELAIGELLTNAITHSPDTDPEVYLRAESVNGSVAIRVQDTNPRIPEMDRNVISGGEELSSLYHGSGMGLWLVSLIANHAGGTLEFETNEPEGNVVSIILPRD